MSDAADRPFDHHTLELDATFVADAADDTSARQLAAAALGHDAVEIPAIVVPDEGGTAPGEPYIRLGIVRLPIPAQDTASKAPPTPRGDDDNGTQEAMPPLPALAARARRKARRA